MPAISKEKRSITIAALVVTSLLAGFVVATTASGQEFATVGTVAEDNQAYQLPLEEDQRVRFALDAADGAENPEARFAVYGPQDRFFGYFDLEGANDDVDMLADATGSWVVFVTHANDANLAVQFDEERNASDEILSEIEVNEHRRSVASQDGGPMDEQLALRLDVRPAVAFLEYTGDVQGLDATVSTEQGDVYRIRDGSANTTDDGAVHRSGETDLIPKNLADGTYKVQATADEFNGSLTFVYQTYDRGETRTHTSTENVSKQVNKTPLADAAIVARAEEHEAFRVPMQGAEELLLGVKGDASARVLVYNSSDDVVQIAEIEGQHDHEYDWDEEENSSEQPGLRTVSLNATDEEHVVFVQDIDGNEDEVFVALAGLEDAEPAEKLKLEESKVVFDHGGNSTQSRQVNLTGGIVGVGVHSQEVVSMERHVKVTGPLGTIAEVEKQASTFGWSWYQSYAMNSKHFSDGAIDVLFEQSEMNLGQGETTVTLHHYVR